MDRKTEVENHIQLSLNKIRVIFEKASERIEKIPAGERLTFGELTGDLAKEFSVKASDIYQTLKYLYEGYPQTESKKGAKGGIWKLPAKKE